MFKKAATMQINLLLHQSGEMRRKGRTVRKQKDTDSFRKEGTDGVGRSLPSVTQPEGRSSSCRLRTAIPVTE